MSSGRLEERKIVKMLLLGSERAGKSALLSQLDKKQFSKVYSPTIGIDYCVPGLDPDFKFQIFELAGHARYAGITKSYVNNYVNLAVFVLDSTRHLADQKSDLMTYKGWLDERAPNAVRILAISKMDRREGPLTDREKVEITNLRNELGIHLDNQVTCSAKTGDGIPDFNALLIKKANEIHPPAPAANNSSAQAESFYTSPEMSSSYHEFRSTLCNLAAVVNAQYNEGKGNLTAADLNKIRTAVITLRDQLDKPVPSDLLQGENDAQRQESARTIRLGYVKAFHEATSVGNLPSLKRTSVWRAVLGAVLGAAIGIAVGALVGAALGPGAIATAIACGLKGAMLGAAIGGVSLSVTGFGCGMWRDIKNQPLKQVEAAANDLACRVER